MKARHHRARTWPLDMANTGRIYKIGARRVAVHAKVERGG